MQNLRPMEGAPVYFSIADCMPKIFDYLQLNDRLNASLVSKYFKGVADDWTNGFGRDSGIESARVIPFLKQSVRFFPQLTKVDLSHYPTVQNYFYQNSTLAAVRLNVGVQMPELTNEILIGLKKSGVATDRFNLYQAILENNIPLLNALLETFDLNKNCWEGHSITKKCHEGDKTLSTISLNKVIRFAAKKGSLVALKAVVNKFSLHLSNPKDVFETLDLAKVDFIADFIDEKICVKDPAFTSIYGNPQKAGEDEINVEMLESLTLEEHSYDFTFGGLLKAITRGNHSAIESLMQKVWIVETHLVCAIVFKNTEFEAYLRARMHSQ